LDACHADRLVEALEAIGTDVEAGVDPEGLTVIRVGDLVHKGPDSARCMEIIERLVATSPAHWVQLVGNHEAQYLGGPVIAPKLPRDLQKRLRRWLKTDLVRSAIAIDTAELGPVR